VLDLSIQQADQLPKIFLRHGVSTRIICACPCYEISGGELDPSGSVVEKIFKNTVDY